MLEGFDFAKGRLGMKLDGSLDDFAYVEVPHENDIMNQHKINKG